MFASPINITGPVTINVIPPKPVAPPERKVAPSIPITPFVREAFLDVDKDLLWFNTHVQRMASGMDNMLPSELSYHINLINSKMAKFAGSDYNTTLVTIFAAEIAAASFLLYKKLGGEVVLANG